MTGRALLIIDMQPAVISGMWQAELVADRLAGVIRRAHHRGVPVLFVLQAGPAPDLAEWAMLPQLGAQDTDLRITKTATDSFYGTDLERSLRDLSATRLVVGGVATDYCVDATTRAAVSRGLDVDLLADAHTTADDASGLTAPQIIAHHNEVLVHAIHPGGTVRLLDSAAAFAEAAASPTVP